MTERTVETLIFKARMGDEYYGYEDDSQLAVLMTLMYYAPMKMVDAMKLTPEELRTGTYVSRQKGTVHFTLPKEQMEYVERNIRMDGIGPNEPILSKTKRAFDWKFRKIANSIPITERLSDIYYLGLNDKDSSNAGV